MGENKEEEIILDQIGETLTDIGNSVTPIMFGQMDEETKVT